VEASLRRLQDEFENVNAHLSAHREPMSEQVLQNMLAGYAFVDALRGSNTNVFGLGNLKSILELNTIVLCGTDPVDRESYAGHLAASEHRFYGEREGGIQDLVEWYAGQPKESVWHRAAGAYGRLLSRPQLFIEGNHRTGTLLMSYVLIREDQPPFVLTPENAAPYFELSAAIQALEKKGPVMLFVFPAIRRRLAELLLAHADRRYLLAPATP
jgi:hypothetical protein